MTAKIYNITYYYTLTDDVPGESCKFLTWLAQEKVSLLSFNAIPIGARQTQLVIYPLNPTWLAEAARKSNVRLNGPHYAFMIHGDDELGALVDIHTKLSDQGINIANSLGISDHHGSYRYLMHVGAEDYEKARDILGSTEPPSDFKLDLSRRFEKTI
jgi:hypothetical protein